MEAFVIAGAIGFLVGGFHGAATAILCVWGFVFIVELFTK